MGDVLEHVEAADALLTSAPERARARLRQALERTRESLAEARRSVLDLRAGPLERQELPAALAQLAERFSAETGVAVAASLALDGPRLPARIEEALFRIAQEALVNVRRHAHAAHVQLGLYLSGDQVGLTVADDGAGFLAEQLPAPGAPGAPAGFGLIGMRERAHLLNGSLRLRSAPGAGTQIDVLIPLT